VNSLNPRFTLWAELAAEVADVHVNCAGLSFILITPDFLEQDFPGHYLTYVFHEDMEQVKFLACEFNFHIVNPNFPGVYLEENVAYPKLIGVFLFLAAGRRRTALMRATSSRGLKGLVM